MLYASEIGSQRSDMPTYFSPADYSPEMWLHFQHQDAMITEPGTIKIQFKSNVHTCICRTYRIRFLFCQHTFSEHDSRSASSYAGELFLKLLEQIFSRSDALLDAHSVAQPIASKHLWINPEHIMIIYEII